MRILFSIAIVLGCLNAKAESILIQDFFYSLKSLNFSKARAIAIKEEDKELSAHMVQLCDLLYYEGENDRQTYKPLPSHNHPKQVHFLSLLNAGYYSLFHDMTKGNAFRNFYDAYEVAKGLDDKAFLKSSLLALLTYYKNEVAQNSDGYEVYLDEYEQIQSDGYDRVWIALFRIIFATKSLISLDTIYFELFDRLKSAENEIGSVSLVHVHIIYERALKAEVENHPDSARALYLQAINLSQDYPFFKDERFSALIKLMMIETRAGSFQDATEYRERAKSEMKTSDSLRAAYHYNLYSSFYFNAQNKNDSAFQLLKLAYAQDFQLDFRRNTLEINRLAVQLETQEKENQNLRLQQSRLLLTIALGGVGGLLVLSYLGYKHQRTRNRVMTKEKEVQSMKIEKLLKDQEVIGIDSMLEGQEKERQRLANELHDHVGSLLATIKLHFHNLRGEQSKPASLEKADELIEEAYQKIRSMAHVKNVGVIAQEGLVPAVRNFAQKASVLDKLTIEVVEHSMDKRLENSLEITLFRIIQELITNIIKHAQATEATIHFTQYDSSINIMVEDNGKGFEVSSIKPKHSMGLYSIQKRIENLGGDVTIESIPGKGTSVIIDVPLI